MHTDKTLLEGEKLNSIINNYYQFLEDPLNAANTPDRAIVY